MGARRSRSSQQPLRFGRGQPGALGEDLDLPQVMRHIADLDLLAAAAVQLRGDKGEAAEADAVAADNTSLAGQEQPAKLALGDLVNGSRIRQPAGQRRHPAQALMGAFGVVAAYPAGKVDPGG